MRQQTVSPTETGSLSYDVGVIGAGYIATVYHLPVLANTEATNITYVADIEPDNARRAAASYGGSAVTIEDDPSHLPDCDIVLLAVPPGVRLEYIREFADRETPIFTEKPFAVNTAMHEEILDLTEDIMCSYQRITYSSIRQVRAILDSQLFGEVQEVSFYEGDVGKAEGIDPSNYRTDTDKSGGAILMEFGSHILSEIAYLFNEWNIALTDAAIIWDGEYEVDIDATLQASSEGQEVNIDYRISKIKPVGHLVRFEFETAIVEYHPQDATLPVVVQPKTDYPNDGFAFEQDDEWATTKNQGVYLRWQQFLSQLQTGEANVDIKTAPRVSELIDDILEEGKRSAEVPE